MQELNFDIETNEDLVWCEVDSNYGYDTNAQVWYDSEEGTYHTLDKDGMQIIDPYLSHGVIDYSDEEYEQMLEDLELLPF